MAIEEQGMAPVAVRESLAALRADDPPVRGGRVMAYVYDAGDDAASEAALDALASFGEVNALDPTTFPSVARLENDLVGWGLDVMRAPDGSAGVVTSGGTESCILAVLAARERWRRLGRIGSPTIVVADTVHPAFHKAAHLLGVDVHSLPVDRRSLRLGAVSVAAALDHLGQRAALVVTSAPSYAHGVIDDVEGVAAESAQRGVPVHVDSCIGGMALAYARRSGEAIPGFDFDVPGVASMSLDLHKYGFAPKGVSLLLFRDSDYRSGTYFTFSSWPGYPIVNTTLQSTKPAAPMAAAWAAARVLGHEGFTEAVRRAREATLRIAAIVDTIPGLRMVAPPDATLVALRGDGDDPIDPFRLADALRARGWVVQPQPGMGDLPRTLHLTVQPVSADTLPEFERDLRDAADEVRGLAWVDVADDLEAAFAELPDLTSGAPLPEEMAAVHALIDALPPQVRDPALAAIFSSLFTARRART